MGLETSCSSCPCLSFMLFVKKSAALKLLDAMRAVGKGGYCGNTHLRGGGAGHILNTIRVKINLLLQSVHTPW